ncbi:unnamed protein product, partial [Discosporangium mesarthrocarpum]
MTTPITVLFNGHRKVLRVGRNDNMSTVVQMACREFGLKGKDVGPLALLHKRVAVDLSQPFRFTGIPQNATLELEEGEAKRKGDSAGEQVRVAMRLPGGRRVQSPFSPDATLHDLVAFWISSGDLPAGVIDQGLSLQFMRTSYVGGDLQSTLRSIGLTGGTAMFTATTSGAPGATSVALGQQAGDLANTGGGDGDSLPAGAPAVAAQEPAFASRADLLTAVSPNPLLCSQPLPQEEADMARAIALSLAQQTYGAPQAAEAPSSASEVGLGFDPATVAGMGAEGAGVGAGAGTGTSQSQPMIDSQPPPVPAFAGGVSTTSPVTGAQDMDVDVVVGDNASGMEESKRRQSSPDSGGGTVVAGEPACRAALELLCASQFDSDSRTCVMTLIKYVDNVLHRPGESKTRQIRCSNTAFKQKKVGRMKGGTDFLRGIGFVLEGGGLSHEIAADPDAHRQVKLNGVFVLYPAQEDTSLLRKARGLLEEQAFILGVPRSGLPRPPKPPVSRAEAGGAAAGQAFDPYKSLVVSTAPTPRAPNEKSVTEQRLDELRAKRDSIEAGEVPDREIKVTLPSQAALVAATQAASTVFGRGRGGGEGSLALEVEEAASSAGDGSLIAKKVARQIAERKKQEDAPFQTRAMRELEQLQRSRAYKSTIIKVQFPDRVVVEATFSSREGVSDLLAVVDSCLQEGLQGQRKYVLYVSPPRTVLKASSTLSEAGLVPAALVYVSWEEVPPAGEAEGSYLRPELMSRGRGGRGSPGELATG